MPDLKDRMNDSMKEIEILDKEGSRAWLSLYYDLPRDKIGDSFPGQAATFIHRFYSSYKQHWNPDKATLLEFGGGPSISALFSACPNVASIVFTEYTSTWRREVELWKARDPSAFDWSTFCRYVVEDLEGCRDEAEAPKRLEQLHAKIQHVLPCDFNSDPPVSPDVLPQEGFDIISYSYVFESCVLTTSEALAGLKRLYCLLKPGGFLTGIIADEMESYKPSPNSEPVYTLRISGKDIPELFGAAGFTVVEHTHIRVDPSPLEKVHTTTFLDHCVVARKPDI